MHFGGAASLVFATYHAVGNVMSYHDDLYSGNTLETGIGGSEAGRAQELG